MKGTVLAAKASGNARQRQCLSREGSGSTRQRQCLTSVIDDRSPGLTACSTSATPILGSSPTMLFTAPHFRLFADGPP